MADPHRHFTHNVGVERGTRLFDIVGANITASCYHHQRLATLAPGLVATAFATDATVEAVERVDSPGWFVGVQWHPEDTVSDDPLQLSLFQALVAAAQSN